MNEGLAIGNSVVFCNFLHYFEVKSFETLKIIFYVLYVDDCFVLIEPDQFNINHTFIRIPLILALSGKEIYNCISSVDVLIRRSDKTTSTTVYRKPLLFIFRRINYILFQHV